MYKQPLHIIIIILLLSIIGACSAKNTVILADKLNTSHTPTKKQLDSSTPLTHHLQDNDHLTVQKDKLISGDTLNHTPIQGTKTPNSSNPFTPLIPKRDAQDLLKHYTPDEIKQMPVIEAHGDTRERSVPFGQTLQKGAVDTSTGPLKNYRMVAFYGNPHSTRMGILGELKPSDFIKKLKAQAQAYTDADPSHPAIPTIELITTIAQRNPGPKGLYYHMTSEKDIQEYAKLAHDNGAILLLDVQLGRDTVMNQVKLIENYLKLPYVYLAIDTEFHVHQGQIPGVQLGRVDGRNIENAIQYVSDLTKANHLPNKVVLVHQFKGDIIQNKNAIKPTNNTEVVINYDGFGSPGSKMASYHGLIRNEPIQYGGFKLFFKNDKPLLTPKQVLELDPAPAVIDYQ